MSVLEDDASWEEAERRRERNRRLTQDRLRARLRDQPLDPLIAHLIATRFGVDDSGYFAVGEFHDDGRIEVSRESIADRILALGPYQRCFAAFHAVDGAAARRERENGISSSLDLAREIFEQLRDEGWAFQLIPESSERASEVEVTQGEDIDWIIAAVDGSAGFDGPMPGVLEGPHGVPIANTRTSIGAGQVAGSSMIKSATCTICLEEIDGDIVTVIRRSSSFIPDPDLLGIDAKDPADFDARLQLLMDPRTWSTATGNLTADGTQQAGWIQSRPNGSPFAQGVPLDFYDSLLGPRPDPPNIDPIGPAGQAWNSPNFYELVWPGFDLPFGVILHVDFQPALPPGGAATGVHRVDYHLNQQILELSPIPGEDDPVGPNVMPLLRDDGYLTVTKTEAQVDGDTVARYLVEMRKELDFQDIHTGKIFDSVEELIPFAGCAWFDTVQMQWLETLVGDGTANGGPKWRSFDDLVGDLLTEQAGPGKAPY